MESDTYRKYENGQTELRVSQLPRLAAAYGVTAEDLARELGVIAEDVDADWDFGAELQRADPGGLSEQAFGLTHAQQRAAVRNLGVSEQRAVLAHLVRTLEGWRAKHAGNPPAPANRAKRSRRLSVKGQAFGT